MGRRKNTLKRCVIRLPAEKVDRLEQIADMASVALGSNVSRATLVRAAVEAWVDLADKCNPELLIEAIRVATVKRGRKPR